MAPPTVGSPAPLPAAWTPGHSPGICAASADSASASGSTGSAAAPSGLMALHCPGVSVGRREPIRHFLFQKLNLSVAPTGLSKCCLDDLKVFSCSKLVFYFIS